MFVRSNERYQRGGEVKQNKVKVKRHVKSVFGNEFELLYLLKCKIYHQHKYVMLHIMTWKYIINMRFQKLPLSSCPLFIYTFGQDLSKYYS